MYPKDLAEHPPLAILFCENQLRFIFFPFSLCVDAIVTPSIKLFKDTIIDDRWFSFICFYANHIFSSFKSLTPEKYGIATNLMKRYINRVEPEQTVDEMKVRLVIFTFRGKILCKYLYHILSLSGQI